MTDRPRNQFWVVNPSQGRFPFRVPDVPQAADRVTVHALSDDFHADVAAELRRLRAIETAAEQALAHLPDNPNEAALVLGRVLQVTRKGIAPVGKAVVNG